MAILSPLANLCLMEIFQAAETRRGGLHSGQPNIQTVREWRIEMAEIATKYEIKDLDAALTEAAARPEAETDPDLPRTMEEISYLLADRKEAQKIAIPAPMF